MVVAPPTPREVRVPPARPRIEPVPPAPAPPKPAPSPEPRVPEATPIPEKTPAPPPTPAPAPSVLATPAPAPEKPAPPAPAADKPVPEATRAAIKGTLLAMAGPCSVQAEGEDAPQSLKPGQKRDFPGTIRLRAEGAPVKAAVGPATVRIQRGSELSIQLQEGRTHVQLARGEAFFDVTPGNGLFEVESAQGKVTVKVTHPGYRSIKKRVKL